MFMSHSVRRRWVLILGLTMVTGLAVPAVGQDLAEDMVGQDEEAWAIWTAAMRVLGREELAEATTLFDKIQAMDLSDLRLALMADRTGVVRFEAWAEKDDAPDSVKAIHAKIMNGQRQKTLAEDGWHYASIGRFDWADAQFKALAESNPDPVALLELARRNPNRHTILIKLLNNTEVGPSAARFLKILDEGEELLRIDPHEIVANIAKLGGSPRQVFNATKRLQVSGEYAVPHMIQALRDSNRASLQPAIIQVLPQIGRSALNPLCIALGMEDDVTKQILANAAGEIGYRQALPHLAKLAEDPNASGDARAAAVQAMAKLGNAPDPSVSAQFYQLAEDYYNDVDSLKADPRKDTANVWYVNNDELCFIKVPTAIFRDVMAMRCCEEALMADPNHTKATALWLAANFRREAQLGLDVQSDQPDPLADKDGTRPEDYPRAIYFARAAGPMYNHMVLARAFKDRDPGVALGAIAALSATAGEPSLVGVEDIKQPLVQTLSFPNRQVRIKAALALARALPKTDFAGAENVMPVLTEALAQSGRRGALIVDPDDNYRNKFQALLRAAGYECGLGANLYQARENSQKAGLTSYDVVLLASDVEQPDLVTAISDLRRQFQTAATPILVVAKEGQLTKASKAARGVAGVEVLLTDVLETGDPAKIQEQVADKIGRASQALGMSPLDAELSLDLAIQAADVLRDIAESNLKVFDFSKAVPRLISTLDSPLEVLRVKCAHALALAHSADAQAAIAEAAMDPTHGRSERVALFGSLAESGRRNGNLLGTGDLIQKLIDFTMHEDDLILRAAASKALGALDLPGNKASEIIRAQYRG
ncbi:MAG: HEAT repeat domain-containing protein [Phycisphaerae bacterium]|nr:HEAT repeat domain-containing protein [Phycisphaerae bacterium]